MTRTETVSGFGWALAAEELKAELHALRDEVHASKSKIERDGYASRH